MEFVVLNDEAQDEAGFLELLSSDLKPFYEPRLPYHNWDEHIEQGLGIIDNLCEQEKIKGNPINSFMAKVAYMGHDAGSPHDLITPDIWEKYTEGQECCLITEVTLSIEKMLRNLASISCFRSNGFNISWSVRSFDLASSVTFSQFITRW